MRPGEDLEKLVETVFQAFTAGPRDFTVERDVELNSPDGARQIDLVLRSSVGPIDLTTIVECKDYKRLVDVTKVDALHSIITDVGASKGVIVSRKGFSRGARSKAARVGIDLFRADQLSNIKEVAYDIPVHVREMKQIDLDIQGTFSPDESGSLSLDRLSFYRLNDMDLPRLLRDDLLRDPQLSKRMPGFHIWDHTPLGPKLFFRDKAGKPYHLETLEVRYQLQEQHYFGYLRDLNTVLYFHDEIRDRTAIVFKVEDLPFDYSTNFAKFDLGDLPIKPALSITSLGLPDFNSLTSSQLSIHEIGPATRKP